MTLPKRKPVQQNRVENAKSESKPIAQAFNVFTVHLILPSPKAEDLLVFFQKSKSKVIQQVKVEMEEKQAIACYLTSQVVLTRDGLNGESEFIYLHFCSKCVIDLMKNTIAHYVNEVVTKIMPSFEEF